MAKLLPLLGIIGLLTSLSTAAKPKVITFGRWMPVQWMVGTTDDKTIPLRVRALMVNNDVKEFTTGDSHQVTDRIFVVRRAYRVNDSLSDEASSVPKWSWQPDGWIMVDRSSAHISKLSLPNYDFLYSTASWYRDYVAYCGISDDGDKLYAMVVQIGQKKPVVKKFLGEAKDLGMPDSQCAVPVWQRQPARVTFAPVGGEKISFDIRGRTAEFDVTPADEE